MLISHTLPCVNLSVEWSGCVSSLHHWTFATLYLSALPDRVEQEWESACCSSFVSLLYLAWLSTEVYVAGVVDEWMRRICGRGAMIFRHLNVPSTVGNAVHLLQIFTCCSKAIHVTGMTLHGAVIFLCMSWNIHYRKTFSVEACSFSGVSISCLHNERILRVKFRLERRIK